MTSSTSSSKPQFYAWLVFLISACFLFYKYILQISPSVMTADLMQAYSLTGTGLGFLVGFYFYTYMIMQIPSGILLDRYGVRNATSVAIFFCALGILIFSYTDSFWLACFARLLIGFGAAFATTSYMKLCSSWFPANYFPLFSGLFGTACMAGAATASAPLAWLINLTNWRQTLFYCAVAGFILLILFWFFVVDRKNKNQAIQAIPKIAATFHFSDLLGLIRNKSNWPLILYGGLAFTPAAVFGGLWGVPFIMVSHHFSKAEAASSVSSVFLGFAIGGIIIGWIGKQLRRQLPVVLIGTMFALVFLATVVYVSNLPAWLLNTCIFMFGLSSSGFLLSYSIARSINPIAIVGTVVGVINMGDPLCGALAEPLIGKILDLNWNGNMENNVRIFSVHAYQMGLSVLIAYLILAIVCCYFIDETEYKNKR